MREFNLLTRNERVTQGLSETKLKDEFSIKLPAEFLIDFLNKKTPENVTATQAHANEIFSIERRDRVLALASKTTVGLPAVYYRYMPRGQFLMMLQNGRHTPQDYIQKENAAVDEATFSSFLNQQYIEDSKGKIDRDVIADFEQQDIQTKMQRLFPSASISRIQAVLRNFYYSEIQKFLDDHVTNQDKRLAHKVGWPGIELSNMLSASAGGPVIASGGFAREDIVYIEFVAPDHRVTAHSPDMTDFMEEHMGGDEEKEVFLKSIPLEWVTRVFIDRKQLIQETMLDPKSAVQHFATTHPPITERDTDPYRNWHRNAKTKDMLPTSIAARFDHRQKESR